VKIHVRTLVLYWMPVIAWMSVIFLASTDLMSAQHTSRFIGPFLRWIAPQISPEMIQQVQFAVRKAAHVTEYAILAALLMHAFSAGARALRWRDALLAVFLAGAFAAGDEYHQSFIASRTGAAGDVLIDITGAMLGALICWGLIDWRLRRQRRAADRVHAT